MASLVCTRYLNSVLAVLAYLYLSQPVRIQAYVMYSTVNTVVNCERLKITFTSLEIHVVMDQDDTSSHYRIFLHNGTLEKKDKVNTVYFL